jgi:hypothetical protein
MTRSPMPLIAITRLRVRSARFLVPFFFQAARSGMQARRARGNLSLAVLRDARRTFWTRTMWSDEEAMRSYVSANPHGQIMRSLAEWCDEASVVHWLQAAPGAPSWPDSAERMQRDGRPTRVNHPTADHRAFRIAPIDRRAVALGGG